MKHLASFLFIIGSLFSASISAQDTQKSEIVSEKYHKIVIQLTSADTNVHKGLMRQLDNMTKAAPNAIIEVVCHGPGINLLVSSKTIVAQKMDQLAKEQYVAFVACENTLSQKKIEKTEILPIAKYTPAGIIYIVEKQEDGWSYIKAGY